MKAMILAAGLGTRLRPFTERLPKPLFPLLGERMLDRCIETVKEVSPDLIVVNAHHLAGQIERHVAEHDYGVEVVVSPEEKILGTAGGIKRAEKWLKDDDFVVMNSDLLMTPDWDLLRESHQKNESVATLLLRANESPDRYSVLRIDESGEIVRFPGADEGTGTGIDYMFSGVSMVSPKIFNLIAPNGAVDIVTEVYAPLVRESGGLYGVITEAQWNDVGTVDDYFETVMTELHRSEITPATMWAELHDIKLTPPVYIETGATVEPGSKLGPNVAIHAGATVGAGAELRNCVVLPGSKVEAEEKRDGEVV